ncbi:MAG: HAD family phosphatase [Bacteroidales bacterium]|nr:HAD family phosphatase [Bacteroidales bacterium]
MEKKPTGALFDLDGVVIDTEGVYSRFWVDIEQKYPTGIPNFAVKIKGTNLASIMSHYTDPVAHEAVLKALAEFEHTMTYEIFPEAERFIRELRAAGVPCAMVTSSGEMKLQRLFAQHPHLRGYFDAIVSGEMVQHSKPHPECFEKGARMIGCSPERCVVFEDSLLGVESGKAAGAKVVALPTTFPEAIKNTEADKIIDSFADFSLSDFLKLTE